MSRANHPLIAREGWPFIGAMLVAGVVFWFIEPEWTALFAVLALALALKFRDPERLVPSDPLGVVSPVDGIVELVEPAYDAGLDRDAVRIRIRIHRFGTYAARAPVEGKVLDIAHNGDAPRGLWLHTDEGDDVLLILNTAPFFARPRALFGYGARIGHGHRCALLRLARIAEVWLPANSRVRVKPGQRVIAGSELLAELVHD